MKIKFIKKYVAFHDFEGAFGTSTIYEVGTTKNVSTKPAQWLIDNGFAEEVNESTWWKPKYGEKYFYIEHDGFVRPCIWENDPTDNGRLKLGSVFKAEEAAIRCRDYWEVIATVRQDEGVLTPEELMNKSRDKVEVYYVGFDQRGFLCPNMISLFDHDVIANAILFDTHEHALASRNKHPDEWKTIAKYKWGK